MVANKKVRVYENLRQRIIKGALQPGLPIHEEDFAREMSVSKTPVREALRQLESEGFVENVRGRGSAVSPIRPQDIREVREIREILEVEAAKRAALQRGSDELRKKREKIRKLLDQEGAHDEKVREWGSWEDVHLSIMKAVGNQTLVDIYLGLLDRIERIHNYEHRFRQRQYREILVEHLAVLDAIMEGDAEGAGGILQRHLRNIGVPPSSDTEPNKP